jgi:hypothetical protein
VSYSPGHHFSNLSCLLTLPWHWTFLFFAGSAFWWELFSTEFHMCFLLWKQPYLLPLLWPNTGSIFRLVPILRFLYQKGHNTQCGGCWELTLFGVILFPSQNEGKPHFMSLPGQAGIFFIPVATRNPNSLVELIFSNCIYFSFVWWEEGDCFLELTYSTTLSRISNK